MSEKKASVLALYENVAHAEQGLDHLTSAEFSSDDVSVLMRADPKGKQSGGTLGLLAGFGPISMRDADPLTAAGPIRNLLGSPIQPATTLGDGLTRCGLSAREADVYASRITEGCVLLSVRCGTSEEVERASLIFSSSGAEAAVPVRDSNGSLESARIGTGR